MTRDRNAKRCTAKNQRDEPCKAWAIPGANVCHFHGGNAPQVRRKAAIRAAVTGWEVGTEYVDPTEVFSRLLTVTYLRAQQHHIELQRLVDEHGWHDAYVGDQMAVDQFGHAHKVSEYARQLAQWEAQERRTAMELSIKAINAGLKEREVRVLEEQAELVAQAIRATFAEMELGERMSEAIARVSGHLRVVGG